MPLDTGSLAADQIGLARVRSAGRVAMEYADDLAEILCRSVVARVDDELLVRLGDVAARPVAGAAP